MVDIKDGNISNSFIDNCNLIAIDTYDDDIEEFTAFDIKSESVNEITINNFLEESNDIIDLLTIINMSIQINLKDESESSEILSILSQKPSTRTTPCKYYAKSSTKFYQPQPRKVSLVGRVLFNSTTTTQNTTKSTWLESTTNTPQPETDMQG